MSGKFIAINASGGSTSGVKSTFAEAEAWAQTYMSSQKNCNEIMIFNLDNPCAQVRKVDQPYSTTWNPTHQKPVEPVKQDTAPVDPVSSHEEAANF